MATVISKGAIPSRAVSDEPASGPGLTRRAYRTSNTTPQAAPWGSVRVTLQVSERFHGSGGSALVVRTNDSAEACGYPFEVGHQYLVFANEFQGELTVTICSGTRPAGMVAGTIRQLRSRRDGTPLPVLFGSATTHADEASPRGWEQVRPVAGVTVMARADQREYSTQTGEDGSYEFIGLSAGRYDLSLAAPGRRVALWQGERETTGANVWQGNSCPTNFEVYYDGLLSGRVEDADGKPLAGVVLAWFIGPEPLNIVANRRVVDGHFEIPRLQPGRYRLGFIQQGDMRSSRTIYYPGTYQESQAAIIELGDGEHQDGLRMTVSDSHR